VKTSAVVFLAVKPPSGCVAGGDSGIGRAVAVHFAREGADLAILYLHEHQDAQETAALVEREGRKCLQFAGDVSKPEVSGQAEAPPAACQRLAAGGCVGHGGGSRPTGTCLSLRLLENYWESPADEALSCVF